MFFSSHLSVASELDIGTSKTMLIPYPDVINRTLDPQRKHFISPKLASSKVLRARLLAR